MVVVVAVTLMWRHCDVHEGWPEASLSFRQPPSRKIDLIFFCLQDVKTVSPHYVLNVTSTGRWCSPKLIWYDGVTLISFLFVLFCIVLLGCCTHPSSTNWLEMHHWQRLHMMLLYHGQTYKCNCVIIIPFVTVLTSFVVLTFSNNDININTSTVPVDKQISNF